MRSLRLGKTKASAAAFKALVTVIAGEAMLFWASFGAEFDRSRLLPCPLCASASLGEIVRAVAGLGATGWAGDLLALGGRPSDDKTTGARLLVADPERSMGDCPDEVLAGLEEVPVAAAAATDLGKRFGDVLLLPGGSLGPSEGGVLLELGFAASPKISLRPDCWEAGLDMKMTVGMNLR